MQLKEKKPGENLCDLLENPRDEGAWWAAVLWGCTDSDMTEAT